MTQTHPHDDAAVVVVTRWKRYGKDRAYARLGELDLGFRDLVTGASVCLAAGHEVTLEQATDELWQRARAARYAARHARPDTGPTPAPVPPALPAAPSPATPSPPPPERHPALLPDRDLATNRPGEAVKARAKALRDAAPVRTRVDRVLGRKTDERNWRIGGDAEEAVAERLERLGPEWRLLHAVPIGARGSDIDHVLIGPGGVFTINAKNHPDANVWVRGDTVKVNGSNQPYVRNSRYEAQRAAKLLSARALFDVEVRGLVAVMGMERGFTVVEQPRDGVVTVVARKQVAAHLAALPAVLGTPSVERIHAVARHLATWQPTTVAWSDTI